MQFALSRLFFRRPRHHLSKPRRTIPSLRELPRRSLEVVRQRIWRAVRRHPLGKNALLLNWPPYPAADAARLARTTPYRHGGRVFEVPKKRTAGGAKPIRRPSPSPRHHNVDWVAPSCDRAGGRPCAIGPARPAIPANRAGARSARHPTRPRQSHPVCRWSGNLLDLWAHHANGL
jgi:hypothetical protein